MYGQTLLQFTVSESGLVVVNLVPVLLLKLLSQLMHACMLQLIHSRGQHCIVAITTQCVPGEVRAFDTVHISLDDETHQTIQRMFSHHTSPLRVTVVNKPKQQGGSDCDVFAIVVCTCLALGEDPSTMITCKARIMDHLLKCFEEELP